MPICRRWWRRSSWNRRRRSSGIIRISSRWSRRCRSERNTDGYVVVGRTHAWLVADFRYIEVARRLESDDLSVVLLENRRAASHILNSSHRYIYERCLMKVCRHVVALYIDIAIPADTLNDAERGLMIDFYKCMIFGIIIDWCDNGMKENYAAEFSTLLDLRRRILDSDLHI